MPDNEDCIDDIANKTGRSRKDVTDDLEELLSRADEEGQSGSPNFGKGGQKLLEDYAIWAARKRRSIIDDQMKQSAFIRGVNKAPTKALGIEAALGGVNAQFEGSRDSIENLGLTIHNQLANGFDLEMQQLKLDKLFSSRMYEDAWGRELYEVSKGRLGQPGLTRNKQALDIAKTIHKWQKVSIQQLNDAGAWVKSYSGYVTKTAHDKDKIRKATDPKGVGLGGTEADRNAWVQDVLTFGLNVQRTFGTRDIEHARAILAPMWTALKNGDHFDITGVQDEIYPNVASQASAHRELHWQSYDAWKQYNDKYGVTDPTRSILDAFRINAQRTALLTRLGTKPRETFEHIMEFYRQNLKNSNEYQSFQRSDPYLRRLYNELDHSENKVGNQMITNLTTGWMTWQRSAKLNRVLMTHIASLQTVPTALRQVGMGVGERYSAVFSNLFRGVEGSAKREVADLMLEGESSIQRTVNAKFDRQGFLGKLSALENIRFRLTGTSSLLERQRVGSETMMAYHFGKQVDKSFDDLGQYEKNVFQAYRIAQPEWDMFKTADWFKSPDGKTYLTPDIPRQIPDDAMRAYLDSKRTVAERSLGALSEADLARGRERLVQQLHALYYDQGRYAMYEPSARVRARLYFGTAQTAPNLYNALKLFWQFRVWPAEMIARTWGRELFGGQTGMQKIAGITELVVGSMIFGTFAEGLRSLVQGQDPTSQFIKNPVGALVRGFTRSGGGTMIGDYIFGDLDRHGHSILASLAGPTYSQIEDINSLKNDIVKGFTTGKWGPAAAETIRITRSNIPAADMWWTFKAFDYLVTYQLQEWLNPGYMARQRKRMRDKQGIEFLPMPFKAAG